MANDTKFPIIAEIEKALSVRTEDDSYILTVTLAHLTPKELLKLLTVIRGGIKRAYVEGYEDGIDGYGVRGPRAFETPECSECANYGEHCSPDSLEVGKTHCTGFSKKGG